MYDSTSDCPKVYFGKVQITLIRTGCDHTIMSMSMRQKNVLKFNMYSKLSFLIKWNCSCWAFYIFCMCVFVSEGGVCRVLDHVLCASNYHWREVPQV